MYTQIGLSLVDLLLLLQLPAAFFLFRVCFASPNQSIIFSTILVLILKAKSNQQWKSIRMAATWRRVSKVMAFMTFTVKRSVTLSRSAAVALPALHHHRHLPLSLAWKDHCWSISWLSSVEVKHLSIGVDRPKIACFVRWRKGRPFP